MEFIIGAVIAGVIAFMVVQDATSLRDEEIAVLGSSSISPGTWGAGVFLLAIVFLPVYVVVRSSHTGRLNEARISSRPAPVITATEPRSPLDEVARAHELLTAGAITQDEFDAVKARVL